MTLTSKLTESMFRAQVVELATLLGWRSYYVEQSTREIVRRRTGARVRVRNVNTVGVGFPDVVLVRARDRRLIFAELKRNKGPRGGTGGHVGHVEPSEEQRAWLEDLSIVASAIGQWTAQAPAEVMFGPMPRMDVCVWRPSDMPEIEQVLL